MRVRELKPGFGVQAQPVTVASRLLAAVPQCPPPQLSNSPAHAFECRSAEADSKVLVEASQHAREVGLLDPYPHVLIGLQPRCYLAQETLARLDARLSGYVDVSAQRFTPIVGEAKEGEGLGPFCPPLCPCNRLPSKRRIAVFSGATCSPKAASRSSTSRRNRSASAWSRNTATR